MNPFQKPFPGIRSRREKLISALGFGIFVALFLGIFQPFGLANLGGNLTFVAMAYGLITTGVMLLMQIGLPLVFPKFYQEECWTVGHEIAHTMGNIVLIAVGNLGYSAYMDFFHLSARAFFIFLGFTIAVGLFPVVIGVLLRQNAYHRKYSDQSDKHNAHLAEAEAKRTEFNDLADGVLEKLTAKLEIRDENGNVVLQLRPEDFIAAESADNYVKVYFKENGDLQHKMFRSSLNAIETSISSHPAAFRSHRTWLVNLDSVSRVEGNARGYALLVDGFKSEIPVARGRIAAFDAAFDKAIA